ncbi:hypothetical protein P153DRAFT_385118 [Dothidotthia symphoricarpi CBS 119687]|uniref:Uncharacterized protein n=1 Tax=Dothidotthia symphoricarpi CBS 119687 TaxID=1392245 RepID=A0A6A6AG50_9PLEO|nr:uncharacterized protein P153DRAFT_385118 [Dothidotthia symphoricarpi CBS 119687]KAF2129887.1 hypothetical protein P153DRAFT_385118 [Dothidotthia symphoricarpi CBS 119687]
MPAERRAVPSFRPVKTERTHEENQERAYIAASRRSDRSLEARIESARRASEIHKKRTGRALRVTEQDVINEEMYEEEDDDLPTQYQRLNAHLHTTSVMFNKKLHDYIATQHGVRNMFMSQYQNPSFQSQPYNNQYAANSSSYPQGNNWLSPSMLPPQQFNSAIPQGFSQHVQPQPSSPSIAQPHGFRQSPYHIPQRSPHQRSASIQFPHAMPSYEPSTSQATNGTSTSQADQIRRMSFPPQAFERSRQRPTPSRTTTSQSTQQPSSPQTVTSGASPSSGRATPQHQSDVDTPASLAFSPSSYVMHPQMLGTNPLSLSLPPESQQLIGSALDPHDPRTALFMAGSDNLPQPFAPTYTYNPNHSPKHTKTVDSGCATPTNGIKSEHPVAMPSTTTPISDGFFSNEAFLTPGNCDYNGFFDFHGDYASHVDEHGANDQLDGNNFVNWD